MRADVIQPVLILEILDDGRIRDSRVEPGSYELEEVENPVSGKSKADPWLMIKGTMRGMGIQAWKLSDRIKITEM